jgi:hypothetical protein
MTMYAMFIVCIGLCPANQPPQEGLLLFTSINDCQAAMATMRKYEDNIDYVYEKDGARKTGKKAEMEKDLGYRQESRCATIYFADYAQTERLTEGRVTCSYTTRMPESVMARLINPYPGGQCKDKEQK